MCHLKQSLGCWHFERFRCSHVLFSTKTSDPNIQPDDRLLQRFRERSANTEYLADRFHLRAERAIDAGKFLECPAWDFDYDVIERRLKTGRGLFGDVVRNFVE